MRRLYRCPDAPDFQALARAIAGAPDRTMGEMLLMQMVALIERELVIARETGYALGAKHGYGKRRGDADPKPPARPAWWS